MRFRMRSSLLLGLALLLAACAAPGSLPPGPTPIPTLIPATLPAIQPGSTSAPAFILQSYPVRPPQAALGEPLYQVHCASCHGTDGRGVVPGARNFNDLDYMRGETPASFYAAVAEGRGEMPPFRDELRSDDLWDVVFYIWRFSTTDEILALGHQIYEKNCASCHGEDGTGTVLGSSDFTDLRLVDSQAPREFYLTITQGKGSMPAWQGRLSQDERWAVIDFLRTFSYDPGLPVEAEVTPPAVSTDEATCDPIYLLASNPFAWDDEQAITAGKLIFSQNCAVCHAADGSGALPSTTDLGAAEAQSELRTNSGGFLCIVAEGRNAMPGWKASLSIQQIWQVLTHIANIRD
ncbi:MAG: hypothetical protein A2Z27_03200 [candidate division Zixibacteria bacterium RBG_16_50_21]|nr:MAG: hypothetical protein A2Z27_03200 [candidate division Zixibacteria bacterium RBG_16_50_21]